MKLARFLKDRLVETMAYKIINGDCKKELDCKKFKKVDFYKGIDLTFLDPPFNQGKDYAEHNDNLPDEIYWQWMQDIYAQGYMNLPLKAGQSILCRGKKTQNMC